MRPREQPGSQVRHAEISAGSWIHCCEVEAEAAFLKVQLKSSFQHQDGSDLSLMWHSLKKQLWEAVIWECVLNHRLASFWKAGPRLLYMLKSGTVIHSRSSYQVLLPFTGETDQQITIQQCRMSMVADFWRMAGHCLGIHFLAFRILMCVFACLTSWSFSSFPGSFLSLLSVRGPQSLGFCALLFSPPFYS